MQDPVEFTEFFTFYDTTIKDVLKKETPLYNKKMACDVHILGNIHLVYKDENVGFTFYPWLIEEDKKKKVVTFTRKVTTVKNDEIK
jgi:hypothetical protein